LAARFSPKAFGGEEYGGEGQQKEMLQFAENLMHGAAGKDTNLAEQDIADKDGAGYPEKYEDNAHGARASSCRVQGDKHAARCGDADARRLLSLKPTLLPK
jgi:hypothetical protein